MRELRETHYNYLIYPILGLIVRLIYLHLSWYIYNSDIERSSEVFVYFSTFSLHKVHWITYASWMDSGLVPYIDFDYEYPPLGALLIFLPTQFADMEYYILAFGYMVTIADVFNIMLICNISSHYMTPKYRKILIWSYIAFPPLIFYSIVRFDSFITLFILLAMYFFFIKENSVVSFFFIGLGILIKIIPVFLILPLTIILFKQRKYKELLLSNFILLITILIGFLPFLLQDGGPEGIWWMLTFHTGRRIDNGAVIFMIFAIPSLLQYGDWYVIPERFSIFQTIIQVIVYFIILWKLYQNEKEDEDVEYVFTSYFWAIVLNTVVNPQFFLTLVAMTCISKKRMNLFLSLFFLTLHWSFVFVGYLIGYKFGAPVHVPGK